MTKRGVGDTFSDVSCKVKLQELRKGVLAATGGLTVNWPKRIR
jgi:hypothetical protein